VPKLSLPALVVAAALVCGGAMMASASNYEVSVVLPNANNIIKGGSVMRDGYRAGTVKTIEVVDGKAKLLLELDDDFGKLHEGVRADVAWKGTIGERLITLTDGPKKNAEIPSGSLLTDVASEPVEMAEVLSALDAPTRKNLNTLIKNINATTSGHEADMKAALTTAGPAVEQLGGMLSDLGTDGEAIQQILTQSNRTMGILAARQRTLSQVVNNLHDASKTVVSRQKELGETLEAFPEVLKEGQKTFDEVPDAVDETVPLLEDLEPASEQLADTSKHLKPVLQDLRPAVQNLRPALTSLAKLLNETPAMMNAGRLTFPDIDKALIGAQPAVDFIRPYTPEIIGWLTNWASQAGNYDSNGHYSRFHIMHGLESVNPSVIKTPGVTTNTAPKPGEPVGQPWEDAYGDGIR
jgi:phospholipid/cholesterol/gamma-HCH transport system substrate-binding protein